MDATKFLAANAAENLVSLQNREQRTALISGIKGFVELPAPIAAEMIRRIVALENKLHAVIQNDKRWFFSLRDDPEGEMFARDMNVLHVAAAKSLTSLIERRGEWSQGDQEPLVQQVVAFAVYHHGAAIKWCFFRHEPVKATAWPPLHRLYQLAESLHIVDTPISLFEREHTNQTTIASLYVRALLIEVLNTGSLTMPQIEIADGWLAAWTPQYGLDATFDRDRHALAVDLDSMAGLQLVTEPARHKAQRFMHLNGMHEQLEAVRAELRAGRPYTGRGLPNLFAMEEHVALLAVIERLYASILQSSATRIEERKVVENTYVQVVAGFDDVIRAIAKHNAPFSQLGNFGNVGETTNVSSDPVATTSDALPKINDFYDGLTLSLEPIAGETNETDLPTISDSLVIRTTTPWRLNDLSSKGMGLIVDRMTGERIVIGHLLAVYIDQNPRWVVGVVARKIEQRSLGETTLGVEILSHTPIAIRLQPIDVEGDPLPEPTAHALYFPGLEASGKGDMMILPGNGVSLKNIFAVKSGDASFDLRVNRVLRKGSDWMGMRFEVIGQHEGTA